MKNLWKVMKNLWKVERGDLERDYKTCIWMIRILVIANGVMVYNWLF